MGFALAAGPTGTANTVHMHLGVMGNVIVNNCIQGVDVQTASERAFNIGWIKAGEYLEYSIAVSKAGNYQVEVLIASLNTAGQLHLEYGDAAPMTIHTLPITGNWQSYQWVKLDQIQLAKGEQIIRFAGKLFTFRN